MSSNPPTGESSWIRIRNQIIINIGSAVGTAICLTILATLVSALVLLVQWLFHFVVIPTNLLVALFFIGVGILIVLLIIGVIVGLVYRWLGKHPAVLIGAFLGLLLGLFWESNTTKTELWEALKKAELQMKTPPPAPPQKEATN